MSNLDNLITKIMNDCKEESKRIIDAANAKALEAIKKSTEAAEKEKEHILSEAEGEASKAAEQMLLRKKLEIRDENLSAKRKMIDTVFEHALQKLNNMSKDEYKKYLHDNLLSMMNDGAMSKDDKASTDAELILPMKYGMEADEVYSLFNNGQMSEVKLYKGEKHINGGFILIKDGIEYNRTFETLIQYYRHELESDIIKILF